MQGNTDDEDSNFYFINGKMEREDRPWSYDNLMREGASPVQPGDYEIFEKREFIGDADAWYKNATARGLASALDHQRLIFTDSA